MNKLIIAIDGPVGSGKSTVARRVAELLGYTYLDSGAMYRAVAWKALRDGVPLDSPERLADAGRARRGSIWCARMASCTCWWTAKTSPSAIRSADGFARGLARRRGAGRARGRWWPSSGAPARRAAW